MTDHQDTSASAADTGRINIEAEHGIVAIDTGFIRPGFDASHLIIENGHAAFVDAGLNSSVPALLDGLQRNGLEREAVDWLILTHVHLDHAGGAGCLMAELPRARVWMHPRGVRHMVDPSALMAGAAAVYGIEEVRKTYGELLPIPPERIVAAHDGDVIELAGRPFLALDTPGHARHHICIRDEASNSFFAGDTFGLSYREFDTPQGPWAMPTTTPIQFDPEALCRSIERMLEYAPASMYLTHYSRIGEVQRVASELLRQIKDLARMARELQAAPQRHQRLCGELHRYFLERLRAHGCTLSEAQIDPLLAMDIELNAQGLGVWLDRFAKS